MLFTPYRRAHFDVKCSTHTSSSSHATNPFLIIDFLRPTHSYTHAGRLHLLHFVDRFTRRSSLSISLSLSLSFSFSCTLHADNHACRDIYAGTAHYCVTILISWACIIRRKERHTNTYSECSGNFFENCYKDMPLFVFFSCFFFSLLFLYHSRLFFIACFFQQHD